MISAEKIIEKLGLSPHPEGGCYREIYSSNIKITGSMLSGTYEGHRSLSTSIYYLLRSGEVSHFHRLKSDEIWYFHMGSPVVVYLISLSGDLKIIKLGCEIDKEEVPQIVIPAGSIFGAEVAEKDSYSLVGCMVSPGFHFNDFELMEREELLMNYPVHKDIIKKFTSDKKRIV